ncbi:MAG: hypothetical protein EHM49_00280 [Deltaproteobacteria bacterium]|nr:MAG: hypothetical protein EHM49_05325 [Deltaproteobacteria bacterium]RPI52605.1 MAG: hypothetical protein EHM49_05300 [Deltaproteobacteria bacterium]RPI56464.1 MAG: hypothetical protein EHM49_00280 [Deltaproteobacteria bacterium]
MTNNSNRIFAIPCKKHYRDLGFGIAQLKTQPGQIAEVHPIVNNKTQLYTIPARRTWEEADDRILWEPIGE